MPAILNHVADEWESGTTGYSNILNFVEPTHIDILPLAAHVEGLQTIEVVLVDCPGLRSV